MDFKKCVFFYLFCFSFLFPITDDYWLYNEKVSLKKDKFYTVWIHRDKGTQKAYKKILYFRWTLFHNKILTMHLNLDKFNHQFVLKEAIFRDSFKLNLFDSFAGIENPFLFIRFDSFNIKTKEANFTFLIRDEFGSIMIEKIKGKN
jgi:hypothetical protein